MATELMRCPTPEAFLAEARTWVGTPFHANQSVKGVGADCLGFVYGAAYNVGIRLREVRRAYPLYPDGTLEPYLEKHLVRADEPRPGDVLMMRWLREPHHLAVYGGETIIQAYVSVRRVVEQPMTRLWWERVVRAYRFREFEMLGEPLF